MTLIDKLSALTGPDREVDNLVATAIGWTHLRYRNENVTTGRDESGKWQLCTPRYTASIDAAMTLVPEGYAVNSIRETTENEQEEHTGDEPLSLWSVTLVRRDCTGYKNRKKFAVAFQYGDGPTPAIALCIAAIKATQ